MGGREANGERGTPGGGGGGGGGLGTKLESPVSRPLAATVKSVFSQDLENIGTASANPLRPSCLRPSGCSPYIVSIILVAPTRGSFFHTYDRAPNTHQEGDAAPSLSTNSCSSLAAVSDISLLAHLFVVFPTACRRKTETGNVTMRRPSRRIAFRWSVRSCTYFFLAAARVCTENAMCV